jgi:iron-sulfur cluster assembly protein
MAMSTATNPTPAAPPAPTVSKMEIEITAAAANEIATQKAKRGTPEAMIRIGVRGGGCTGFTYVFEWAEQVRPTDKVFSAHGQSVVVDPKSLVYLGGLIEGHALDHLGRERARRDRGAAAERLELRVGDHAVLDADLEPHHIAARGCTDESGADLARIHVRLGLERPDVAGVLVVLDDLF